MRNAMTITVLLGLSAAAWGQAQSQPAKGIERFVDDETVAVIWVDVQRLVKDTDWAKFDELVVQVTGGLGPDGKRLPEVKEMHPAARELRDGLEKMSSAGAEQVYMVVSMMDIPRTPPIVVRIKPGSDIEKIKEMLPMGKGRGADTAEIDGWLVVADEEQIGRIKGAKPAGRPDLVKAIAEASGGAVGVAAAPTNTMRKVIAEMMPNLPAEVGGGPSTTLTEGVAWIAAKGALPPKLSLDLVIQSQSEQGAKQLDGEIEKFFSEISRPPAATQGLSISALSKDAMRREAQEIFPNLKELLATVRPKLQKDRLTLSLDADKIKTVMAALEPAFARARNQARRAVSASNLKSLAMGLYIYAQDQQDRFPPNLQALVKKNYVPEGALVNPLDPGNKEGYVYARPSGTFKDMKEPQKTPLVYEAKPFEGMVNVAMADGHVEVLTEQELQALLAKASTIPASAPDGKF